MYAVEEKHHLKRNFWLDFDSLRELPSEVLCFLTIMEWLNYESWEDFGSALSFNLDIVTEQIENKLRLLDLANSLRQSSQIQTLAYAKNKASKGIRNYIKARNKLTNDEKYRKCEEDFIIQRPILIDRLYELVNNNIDKFP